ncbi:MAG: tyrosine recombinase XerD, partial [Paludibacter sp.]
MENVFREYLYYLKVEKGLSENSVVAYRQDLEKLFSYLGDAHIDPVQAQREHLSDFLVELSSMGIQPRTQARILSGIKSFYRFLLY